MSLPRDDRRPTPGLAQALVEYGIIVGILSVGCIVVLLSLGFSVEEVFGDLVNQIGGSYTHVVGP